MGITPDCEIVKRAVEEAKLKYFSVSRDELKGAMKKSKAAKTSPDKKPEERVGIFLVKITL